MRTIDPILTAALAAGTGKPILTGYIGYSGGGAIHSQEVTHYKLTGSSLEIEMPWTADLGGDQSHIWLKRGLSIAGVDYTLTTSRFPIASEHYQANGRQLIRGSLLPKRRYSASGHGTYQNIINAFCVAFSKTPIHRDPAAAWLSNTFLPLGTNIVLDDPNAFAALLRQKYLVFMADRGNEELLFYSCAGGLAPAEDLTYPVTNDFYVEKTKGSSRQFVWIDELGAVHTDGTATDPIHNLGFMWSTNLPPAIHTAPSLWQLTMRPDFRILDGDIIAVSALGSTQKAFALVTEEYTAPDKTHPHPRWMTTITANEVFGNTAGGSMPSSWERVSNYTPLNTSAFDGHLSPNENNLQAAMDRLDDHSHRVPFVSNLQFAQVPAATAYYWTPATQIFNATGFNINLPAGRINNLRVRTNSVQPAGGSFIITVQLNTAASPVTITIPANGAAGQYQDTTYTATVAAGDTCRVQFQNNDPASSSAQLGAISFEFLPDP